MHPNCGGQLFVPNQNQPPQPGDGGRSLPFGDATRLSFKLSRSYTVPRARLGWLLICVGSMAWLIFGRNADWATLRFFQQTLRQTNGLVVVVSNSRFTSGSDFDQSPIRVIRFSFTDHLGNKRSAESWADSTSLKRDAQVRIEYVETRPEICRILGYRAAPLPLWAGLVLLFPLFGTYLILMAIVGPSNSWTDETN